MLLEVEDLMKRKSQHAPFQTEIPFVADRTLHKLEQISNQLVPPTGEGGATSDEAECSNIMVQYRVLRIFDLVMKCRLLITESKATGSLVYLVNNIFQLHDVFVGTPLSKRMVSRSKSLLQFINKRKDINEEQSEEIAELLALPSLKGSEFFNNVRVMYT